MKNSSVIILISVISTHSVTSEQSETSPGLSLFSYEMGRRDDFINKTQHSTIAAKLFLDIEKNHKSNSYSIKT